MYNNIDISINTLNLDNDAWYMKMLINYYSNFSFNIFQPATHKSDLVQIGIYTQIRVKGLMKSN